MLFRSTDNSLKSYDFLNNKKHDKEYCGIDLKLNPINIIMPYGGYDLSNILNNKNKIPHLEFTRMIFIKHFKLCFKHLLFGIKIMHDSRIVNRDIKNDNIMINYIIKKQNTKQDKKKQIKNELKNIKIRFIDFGLSSILTPSYCSKMSNIDIRGTPGSIAPELYITHYINDNRNFDKIKDVIKKDIKDMFYSFKDPNLIEDFDNIIIELYKKILNEFKNNNILNNFFGTEKNKYNGYLQKGDIFSLGITIYEFLNYYKYAYNNNQYNKNIDKIDNININNPKLYKLLYNMTKINPDKRYNILQCLNDPYFTEK